MNAYAIPGTRIDRADCSIVIDAACKIAGCTYKELVSRTRLRKIALSRFAAMVLIKELTDLPIMYVARLFNRHHATFINAKKVHSYRHVDPLYNGIFKNIQTEVNKVKNYKLN